MATLIVFGIVVFMAALPVALSSRPAPRRTVRMIHLLTIAAVLVWALACRNCYPRLVFPQ